MKLIVGLGNPGKEYEKTRHNVGFIVMSALEKKYNLSFSKSKFQGLYAETNIDNEKVIFLKPQKYMNLSGEVISEFVKFFKIPLSNLLIFVDDLDLPCGKIRIRQKGSPGGHNGLKDIEKCLGTDEYYRYYPAKILTMLSDINADDGERVGQIMNAYQCSFTMKLEFFGTGFYYLFSDRIHDIPKMSMPDDSTLIPICTDVLLEEDLCLAPGWKVYNHFSCQLDKKFDNVKIGTTLNQSIKEAIKYHLSTGRPLVDLIDIKIRRQGKLLLYGKDYTINWNDLQIDFLNKEYGFFTYTVIISINVLYINELIKNIYNLK